MQDVCIIVGCIWDWWFICTSSINLDATAGNIDIAANDVTIGSVADTYENKTTNKKSSVFEIEWRMFTFSILQLN